jgi:hypothetical protein
VDAFHPVIHPVHLHPVILPFLEIFSWKKIKKYLEAPKLKMAAQFKMAAKI